MKNFKILAILAIVTLVAVSCGKKAEKKEQIHISSEVYETFKNSALFEEKMWESIFSEGQSIASHPIYLTGERQIDFPVTEVWSDTTHTEVVNFLVTSIQSSMDTLIPKYATPEKPQSADLFLNDTLTMRMIWTGSKASVVMIKPAN